jgi:hypothetical protein
VEREPAESKPVPKRSPSHPEAIWPPEKPKSEYLLRRPVYDDAQLERIESQLQSYMTPGKAQVWVELYRTNNHRAVAQQSVHRYRLRQGRRYRHWNRLISPTSNPSATS